MRKFVVFAFLSVCLLLSTGSSWAQPASLPDATAGVPYSFDFAAIFAPAIAIGAQDGLTITLAITLSGALPPGLTLESSGLLDGTPTAPGNSVFTITFSFLFSDGTTTFPLVVPEPFALQVVSLTGPPVIVNTGVLGFPFGQGSTTPSSQTFSIGNRTNTAQTFTASASTNSGGNWLSVAPASGSIGAFLTAPVKVTANPAGLAPGTYRGAVTISTSPASFTDTIPVLITISGASKQIQLSESGLRFQTVAGGGAPPSQSIVVLNGGAGSLPFTVSASTLSGGGWLSVSPAGGTADATNAAVVAVNVNPTGLAAGDYYGQLQFTSPGVDNSPQTASIVLNVAKAGTDVGATVFPTGLIFVGAAGGANPAAKPVQVTNPSPTALTFNSLATFDQGKTFFTAPASGTVSAGKPASVSVQTNTAGLAPGVYSGDLSLHFSDNQTRHIFILLIVTPGGSTAGPVDGASTAPLASGCTPTKLIPVFTQLGQSFAVVAAWPASLEVTVVDDCGNSMTSGSVVASFSSGDPPLSLLSLRDGRWSNTWQPRASAASVTITADAQQTAPALVGNSNVGGALQGNPAAPVISAGGAVSAASFAGAQPLAPGSFISIFGAHLGSGLNVSGSLPLATKLGATQAVLAGRALPLQFTVDGQVNAIVPYDVPANTTQQLVVLNGAAVSVPESVVVAPAQPAIFTKDASGQGAGIVVGVKADGTQALIDANHPVSAGDAVVIYCAGLGLVSPPITAGSATPLAPLSNTLATVTATIGGQPAPVFFSGMTPQFAGLYQVNAIVPAGVTPGNNVPLVISAAGQDSTPVTIVVK